MNQVVLVGRLTDNPVAVETVNGKKVTTVIVAVQRNYKNADGIYETDFIRCVLWNAVAANTSEYCHAGDVIGIKGRLQNRAYENENKETKYITEVIAEKITFLSSKKPEEDSEIKVSKNKQVDE